MRGFTLIEMLVTLAILALLASLALPLSELSVQRARERDLRHALRTVRGAIDAYKQAVDANRIARQADASGYPPTLEVLVEGVKDAKDPKGAKIYFLRRIPRDPFGSIMITNIGSLGLEQAYVPLVPYSRVPLLVAMGAVEDVPLVEDGAVVVGKVMRVCATFDHRVLDGSHAAAMSKTLRAWMEHPFEHFDALPEAEAA